MSWTFPHISYYKNYNDAISQDWNYTPPPLITNIQVIYNYTDYIIGHASGNIGSQNWVVACIIYYSSQSPYYIKTTSNIPQGIYSNAFDFTKHHQLYYSSNSHVCYLVYPYPKVDRTLLKSVGEYGFDSSTDTFQKPYIKWKGKTFNQIIAFLQKNSNKFVSTKPNILMRPLSQKLYRKEIGTPNSNSISKSQRAVVKFDNINAPNGYLITNSSNISNQLSTTLDINYVNNKTEHPKTCSSFNNIRPCISTEANAKSRVRSAGMYRKKFNINRNNDSIYHSSTNDYLVSRSKTFQQNQYQYFRKGISRKFKPGQTYKSFFNDNQAQGIQHCFFNGNISSKSISNIPHKSVSYKPNNWKFGIQGAVDSSCLTNSKNTYCKNACFVHPKNNLKKNFPIMNFTRDRLREAIM